MAGALLYLLLGYGPRLNEKSRAALIDNFARKKAHMTVNILSLHNTLFLFLQEMCTDAPIHIANIRHRKRINCLVTTKPTTGFVPILAVCAAEVLWRNRIWYVMNVSTWRRNPLNVQIAIMPAPEGTNSRSILLGIMVRTRLLKYHTRRDRWGTLPDQKCRWSIKNQKQSKLYGGVWTIVRISVNFCGLVMN